MGKAFRQLLTVLLILISFWLLWVFAKSNPEPLQLKFLNWRSLEVSTGLLVSIVFFLGVLVSGFFFFSLVVSTLLEKRRILRENESLQRLLNQHYSSSSNVNKPPI